MIVTKRDDSTEKHILNMFCSNVLELAYGIEDNTKLTVLE